MSLAVGVGWKEFVAHFWVWTLVTWLGWMVAEVPMTSAFWRQAAPEEPYSVAHWDSVVVWGVRSSS